MHLIFVGSVVDTKTLSILPDASVAGNKMQLGFIGGFVDNGVSIDVISVEPQKMWFFNSKPISVKKKKMFENDIPINTISFCNLPIIKQISISKQIEHSLKKIIRSDSIILVYNTMSMFALPVLKIAKKNRCKCGAIVADLPLHLRKNPLVTIEEKKQVKHISKFDFIIPLTKQIHDDFAPNLPFCVVEAGCDSSCDKNTDVKVYDNAEKHIVFSGTFNRLSGLELLIESMNYVHKDVVLDIYGRGPDEKKLINSSNNPNVRFHGFVSSEEMYNIQRSADLLACPRQNDDELTKYTFPSKVMEYICSGVPTIANHLPCFPPEYDEYLIFSNSCSSKDWGRLINEVLFKKRDFYLNKASKAKQSCLENKNWKQQSLKVIMLIEKLGMIQNED